MPQTLTVDVLAPTIMDYLRWTAVLARTITIDPVAASNAKVGKSVLYAKPRRRQARHRSVGATTAITMTESVEDDLAIMLTDDVYDARPITDAELTLDIRDFGVQILAPMVDAVVDEIDDNIAALMLTAPYPDAAEISHTNTTNGANIRETVIQASNYLDRNEVPSTGRIMLCGLDVHGDFNRNDNLTRVNESGDGGDALRRSTIGTYGNFTIVKTIKLPDDVAIAYHPSAFIAALRAPIVPRGAVDGESRSSEDIAMTLIFDYDADTTQDRMVIRTFYGDTYNTDYDLATDTEDVFKRAAVILADGADLSSI